MPAFRLQSPSGKWVDSNKLAQKVKALVVCEINMGQMVREVERAAKGYCEVQFLGHPGGGMHAPDEILQTIQKVKI